MADVDWAILCDYAFLDVGRKTCIIGVFQRIFVNSVPAHHHQLALVIRFIGEPGETVKFKIEIVRPPESGGGTVGAVGNEIKLGDTGTAEFITQIAGLPLPDYGAYSFNIYADENKPPKAVTFTVERPPKGSSEPPSQ
ncbi:MAG: hypothetical protein HYS38_01455 [Acidobacteria bacterium]|nr:hypothetical protein [Acidobacteriota bacterium]